MQDKIVSIGSIFTAFLASLCCLGPALLAIAGVGSVGFLSVFEAYRPYLIGLTVLLLATGLFFAYRGKKVECEDGTCKIESAGKWNKILLWVAALVAVFFLSFPYLNINSLFTKVYQNKEGIDKMNLQEVFIPVEGMTCSGCEKNVESAVSRMEGISEIIADHTKSQALVKFDKNKTSVVKIVEVINAETGYKAQVSGKEINKKEKIQ